MTHWADCWILLGASGCTNISSFARSSGLSLTFILAILTSRALNSNRASSWAVLTLSAATSSLSSRTGCICDSSGPAEVPCFACIRNSHAESVTAFLEWTNLASVCLRCLSQGITVFPGRTSFLLIVSWAPESHIAVYLSGALEAVLPW